MKQQPQWLHDTLYEMGALDPNYPMPAIAYHVDRTLVKHGLIFIYDRYGKRGEGICFTC